MTAADAGSNPRPGWRQGILRWGLLALVVGAFAWAVGDRWADVRDSLGEVPTWSLFVAWGLATLGLIGPWRAWDAVVTDLGTHLESGTSAKIFFVGQLGKYLPGAVWPVLLQMRLAKDVELSRTRIALSFVVTLIIGVATGLAVGTLALPAFLNDGRRQVAWLLLLLLPLALATLFPHVLGWVARLILRVTRRPAADVTLTWPGIRRAVAGTCTFWVVGGLHLWLLTIVLGGEALPSLAASLGALALGVSLGPLVVVLPAGAGLREAVLVAGLTTVLPLPDAVGAALVSRAIMVLGDGTLALAAFVLARRSWR